jgi:hypothetical protein
MDITGGVIPESMEDRIASTASCVAIGTLCEMDGETEITLADGPPVKSDAPPIFDGMLDSPSRRIGVFTSDNNCAMEIVASHVQTRIRIWTNHCSEPDRIHIEAD